MSEFPTAMVMGTLCEENKQINMLVCAGILVPKGVLLKISEDTINLS